MTLPVTTSQTIGPFSHEAWAWAIEATASTSGSAPSITVSGQILDGAGAPIDDAMIEMWCPDARGAERTSALPGFRRVPSGADGGFSMTLSHVPVPGQPAALVTVLARGLLVHQFSAVFLEDDPHLATSATLGQVPSARRATLIARKIAPGQYRWDVRMQGEHETVFFDYA